MRPEVPADLLRQAAQWSDLHRWERSELGKALRRLGLTYGEIRKIIPVPKGTLSGWCRGIELPEEQVAAIRERTPSQKGIPKDTQWKRRLQIDHLRAEAATEALHLQRDPAWVGGVALYWGEGSKADRRLSISNSDPRLLAMFMKWVETYLDPTPTYSLALNLHADNDELLARRYWSGILGVPLSCFTKTHVKAEGTGHRKNHLRHGVCRVLVRKSTDAWVRTMVWVDVLASSVEALDSFDTANLVPGR